MTLEQLNNRTVNVRMKRKDLVTLILAVGVMIKATQKDHIPNDQIVRVGNILAKALNDWDDKYKKGVPIRDAKTTEHT